MTTLFRCHQNGFDALTFIYFLISTLLLLPHFAGAQNLTESQIGVISDRLEESALKSWELGTRAQAILELNASVYSVFSSTSLPPPSNIPSDLTGPLEPFFAIAKTVVSNRTVANNKTVGPQPLIPADGSSGDPASIGISVLLANWTNQDMGQIDYAGAAQDQLDYLLQHVPKTSDGAISHRESEAQLWSDFIYMVPPFLAYYGVLSRNHTLLSESYNQIKLYRNYLRDPAQNMWKHIQLGSTGIDNGFWSTGNGWAAAGMLRVLATMRQSEFSNTLKNEQNDLSTWVQEIHSGIYPHLTSQNLFANYADQPPTAPGNFYDTASTALIASTVYRAAVMLKQFNYIPFAEKTRMTLLNTAVTPNSDSSSFDGFSHLTSDGWLTPVVNPNSYGMEGEKSPESEAFVLEMQSAWRDWLKDGSHGVNGNSARSTRSGSGVVGAWVGVGLVSILMLVIDLIA